MPHSQSKIINKLLERRQIETDLQRLLSATSEVEFRRQAQQIAGLGSQVIPTLLANLERADERMLTAMGVVAAFLDRDEIVQALRQAVLRPSQTDRSRMGAMTILERFLGQAPDDTLLTSVKDPQAVAIAALEKVLSQAEARPAVLADYVEGLDRQEPDVVLGVVRTLRAMAQADGERADLVVEPLRLMAQDVRDEIAAAALEVLGDLRLPQSAQALQVLLPVLSPALRPGAERRLRKLQFSGLPLKPLPPPDPGWRTLVSPINGLGQQSAWFVQEQPATGHARFLNVLLNDRAGAVEAGGHSLVPVTMLPPRRGPGSLHDVLLPDGTGSLLLLEVSFDVGRRLVRDALAHNRETQIPVAGTLRFLGPWLWGFAGAEALPARQLPEATDIRALAASSGELVRHPAFATWTLRAGDTVQRLPGRNREALVQRLAGELFADPYMAEVLQRRLMAMSEWLWLAGEALSAQQALAAAVAMAESPQALPFVQALIRRDLELLHGLAQEPGRTMDKEQSD